VRIDGRTVEVEGPKGRLELGLDPSLSAEVRDGALVVRRENDERRARALHGLSRRLLANMVEGVTRGFSKTLEIHGVGYRAEVKGNALHLALGFSHPIVFALPPGIQARVDRQTVITLEGADRQLVGEVAARIRRLRPPEPYKGKGIRYAGETIRRKAGKAAAGAAG
jgi:large subunit ribosomal protein L6